MRPPFESGQYASHEYQELLATPALLSSMSRRANCWDNAVAESFFAPIKTELAYQTRWSTRAQTRSEVFEYIEIFYNRRRRHSTLGYLCPDEFERRQRIKKWLLNLSVHTIGASS